jgi:hypothetical protein
VTYKESQNALLCNNFSQLKASVYQIFLHKKCTKNQISQQIGDFWSKPAYGKTPPKNPDNCIHMIMENFDSLGSFTKGTKINQSNKLCHQFKTDILQDARCVQIGAKLPRNNNAGMILGLGLILEV